MVFNADIVIEYLHSVDLDFIYYFSYAIKN